MKATTSCRWVNILSLVSILAPVVGAVPAHSQPAAVSGSEGSRPGGGHEPSRPAKPRGGTPADTMRRMGPSDVPGQIPITRERTQALEERLRRGQMDQAIAQGQISDRLEQFHRGSADGPAGVAVPGQSVQGIVSE